MANSDTPRGLRPTNTSGGDSDPVVNWHVVLSTNATMAVGDLVQRGSAGTVDRWTSGRILGVVAGFKPEAGSSFPNEASTFTNRERSYLSASIGTGWLVGVYDDPNQLFEVQCDNGDVGGGVYPSQTHVGNVADALGTAPTSFNLTTGRSNMELDTSTIGVGTADVGYSFLILGFSKEIGATIGGTAALGEFAKAIVKISYHQNRGQAIGTIGTASVTPGL